MRIDWPYFVAALVLLLTPIGFFHGRRVHYRPLERQWGETHLLETLSFGLHAIDLMRATLGAWLLLTSLESVPGTRGLIRHGMLVIPAAVLCLGVMLQSLVCREPDSSHAPFSFVTGVVIAYCIPVNGSFSPMLALVGGFALVLSIVVALGTRAGPAFFPSLALLLPALGFVLIGTSAILKVAGVAVMALLPWLLSMLFSRHMVLAYRSRHENSDVAGHSRSPLR